MGLIVITPPADLPVTLAEQKLWSRVDHSEDDAMLTAAITAATGFVEKALGRQLVTASYELTLRGFCWPLIRLPRPPLTSVTSIIYRDLAGTLVTMPSGDYRVDTTSDPGTVEPVTSWPAAGDYPDGVAIRYSAGYGDPADVPENIKIAIKGLTAHWYEEREGVRAFPMSEVPMHVTSIIHQARLWAMQ